MPTVIRNPDLARQDLAADFLRHHGVLGMKWGHRRAEGGDSGGSSSPRKSKPSTQDILDARARSDSRVRRINAHIDEANLGSGASQKKAAAAIKKIQDEGQDDLKTAMKSTRGEKVANGILLGVTGTLIVASVVANKRV